MYTIIVDMLLVSLVVMLGTIFFLGSLLWILVETGSQAVARATMKFVHTAAHFQLPALWYQLQPHRAASRARVHG